MRSGSGEFGAVWGSLALEPRSARLAQCRGSSGAKPALRPSPGFGAPAPCHDRWHPPWDSVSPSHREPQFESRIFQIFIPFPFNHLPRHAGQTPSILLLPWNRRKKRSNVEIGGVPDRSTGFRENESSGGPQCPRVMRRGWRHSSGAIRTVVEPTTARCAGTFPSPCQGSRDKRFDTWGSA